MQVLITGGCGFIGCNTAVKLLSLGHEVTVLDNLSRAGAESNLGWIRDQYPCAFVKGDVRDSECVQGLVAQHKFDAIIHLAAQVAVTTSVTDPRTDCDINLLGTFNVLEAVRTASPRTIVLNASTNKVYGKLAGITLAEDGDSYTSPSTPGGISEGQSLEFYSPYGCSKGAGDQYVMDYARIYGIRTVTFRQSCIYGTRQFGVEDQGWVAWFIIAHVLGRPITIYGNGKQVRDILFVEDLVDVYLKSIGLIDRVSGFAFNIGGGRLNALSIRQFFRILGEISGRKVEFRFADWRPGDQLYYVSNVRKAESQLDWRPVTTARQGILRLYEWVSSNVDLFAPVAANA